MRGHLTYAVEDKQSVKCAARNEATTLEEGITPTLSIILYSVVSFCLDPEVERDESKAYNPTRNRLVKTRK